MKVRPVRSREYKVMLDAARFSGGEDKLLLQAQEYWEAFRAAIAGHVIDIDGTLRKIKKRRTIQFRDLSGHRLRENDYVFRERQHVSSGKREVTLKFRHPDRYLAADRKMRTAGRGGRSKLEEDVKAPFTALYSHSTTVKVGKRDEFLSLGDVTSLFPGLKGRLGQVDRDEPLGVVGEFTAREIVITGAAFRISKKRKTEAECALVVWYSADRGPDAPVVAEFSFRYRDDEERYTAEMAGRAYRVFEILASDNGNDLAQWVTPRGMTKTAYVYSLAGQ